MVKLKTCLFFYSFFFLIKNSCVLFLFYQDLQMHVFKVFELSFDKKFRGKCHKIDISVDIKNKFIFIVNKIFQLLSECVVVVSK